MRELERGSDLYLRLDVRDVDCTAIDITDSQVCKSAACELWTRGHDAERVEVDSIRDNVAYVPYTIMDTLQAGQIILKLQLQLFRNNEGSVVHVVKTVKTDITLTGEPGAPFAIGEGAEKVVSLSDGKKVVAYTDIVLSVSLAQLRMELSYCDIKDIEYQESEEDGGTNILTIVTEDGTRRSFPIKNGRPGTTDYEKLINKPDIEGMTASIELNAKNIALNAKEIKDLGEILTEHTKRLGEDAAAITAIEGKNKAQDAEIEKVAKGLDNVFTKKEVSDAITNVSDAQTAWNRNQDTAISKRLETSVFDTYKTEQTEKESTQDTNIKALSDYLTEEKQAAINDAISKAHTQNTDSKLIKGIQSVEVTEQSIKLGHYAKDEDNLALALGNGTSDNHHNAMSVDWNGNFKVGGNITDGEGNVLAKKATLTDLVIDGRVLVYSAENNGLISLTTEELRNLLMWVGTESELDALPDSEIVEGRIYSTFDGTIKRR